MKSLQLFSRVPFAGLLACGLLAGCAHAPKNNNTSTPPITGNPNGSWQLYVNDSTNGTTGGSTNGWQLSIHDETNNSPR
ncbi:MAG TPA: hypothetical protein VK742_09765 [Candidatus Sulfotelmatobacter sp.]|nr:hypothetical protein [Candidatus Sulfotelmatobacter sp.]